ncbi:Glutathione hydrolase proenzyme [Sinobacterium norvegicum]|uniref:Glutathione hydrolase proenzyme n=1 Tax=Sinobacterium norvegicum TaxID=1641715 RepID=A0ABM9AIA2_9GAMM|nr:gamma-glutamyltransferase [Sinobacterium norvegicum]CAH0992960.1 Glutathione hydrolase proenzyme [Sinobacterium norvegicum]
MAKVSRANGQGISLLILLALLLTSYGAVVAATDDIAPEASSGIRAEVNSARFEHAIAVTANPYASDAANDILKRGGSAIDAAITAQLVLGLVEPQSSGIGGGAFLLHYNASQQQLAYFDGRETAPTGVGDDLFLNGDGQPMGFYEAVVGGRSVGVPGVVAMLEKAHQHGGKLPWKTLFEPAIRLSRDGFIVSERMHQMVAKTPKIEARKAIRDYLFIDDNPVAVGYRLKNPAYADTLTLIAQQGSKGFYQGAVAAAIVAAVQTDENAGSLAINDLKNYHSKQRRPLCGQYREFDVCGAAPPSSGASTVIAILGVLEQVLAQDYQPSSLSFTHLFAESSRLAFADRNRYVGDPDFVEVPLQIIAPKYLQQRAQLLRHNKTMPADVAVAGRFDGLANITAASPELSSTTHLVIVDSDGNSVSMTSSIENAFGSRLMVAGFILNNQLTDFSFSRDADDRRVANRVEANKRPRSSMSPMIVMKNNRPYLLIGSPGGARIIDFVAKTTAYVLDQKLGLAEAIASPQIIHMGRRLELEQSAVFEHLKPQLEQMGHRVDVKLINSGIHAVLIGDSGELTGAADPRREGRVSGY